MQYVPIGDFFLRQTESDARRVQAKCDLGLYTLWWLALLHDLYLKRYVEDWEHCFVNVCSVDTLNIF